LIVVDCYLLAGLVFTLASETKEVTFKYQIALYRTEWSAAAGDHSLYGLHYRLLAPYFAMVAVGLVVGWQVRSTCAGAGCGRDCSLLDG